MFTFGANDWKLILKDFGEVTFYFSLVFLFPILLVLIYGEPLSNILYFLVPFGLCISIGHLLKTHFKNNHGSKEIHAFVVITLVWFVLTFIAGLPFMMSTNANPLDAYFESVSALTTTGLSVISNAPHSVLFWRALEGWIGGAGIVVLALVGILRYTRNTKLFQAESGEEKLKPSIVNTIKTIWWVYTGLTVLGIFLLLITGVDAFNSITMAMDAISTTGTANTMSGLLEFNFLQQGAVAIIMLLGGISFAVHFKFLNDKKLSYIKDTQVKLLFGIVMLSSIILIPKFIDIYGQTGALNGVFHVISAVTGGGFQTVNAVAWDSFTKVFLGIIMAIGASAGSTCGGIKLARIWILIKSVWWKIKEYLLPKNSYFRKEVNGKIIVDEDINLISLFVLLYIAFLVLGTVIINYTNDYSIDDAFLEVSSAQANAGITAGITHQGMPWLTQVVLIFNMIIGRLEIIPIIAAMGFMLKLRG